MKLVNQKVETGDIQSVVQPEEGESPRGAQILDLTELLQRSLKSKESEGGQKRTSEKGTAKPRAGNAAGAGGSHKRRA
jgi:DNA end-binding protein Ku